jgi:hypothetical protein
MIPANLRSDLKLRLKAVPDTKGSGLVVYGMDKVCSSGPTVLAIMAHSSKAEQRGMVSL